MCRASQAASVVGETFLSDPLPVGAVCRRALHVLPRQERVVPAADTPPDDVDVYPAPRPTAAKVAQVRFAVEAGSVAGRQGADVGKLPTLPRRVLRHVRKSTCSRVVAAGQPRVAVVRSRRSLG